MRIFFSLCLYLTIAAQEKITIPNVDMKPEGKFLRVVINDTVQKVSGVFLFAPDNTVVLFVEIGRPVPIAANSWDRSVVLSSTEGPIVRTPWLTSVICQTNPTASVNFELFVYYNSQSWKVCGEGIEPCSMQRVGKNHFGPEKVSRVEITTTKIVALTTCISKTEVCPV